MTGPPTMPNVPRRPSRLFGKDESVTWAERLDALRNIPPLLKMVWETHRGYAALTVALRLLRSLVPLAVLWIGKLIIDAVVAGIAAHHAGQSVDWRGLWVLVGIELAMAVVGEATARGGTLVESLLGDLFSNRVSVELMDHAARLDLRQFEDPECYDHLERARRQTVGRIQLIAILLSMAQSMITLVSLAAALLLYVPWLLA